MAGTGPYQFRQTAGPSRGAKAFALLRSYSPPRVSTYGPGIPVQRSMRALEGASFIQGQALRHTDILGNGNFTAKNPPMLSRLWKAIKSSTDDTASS